MAATIDQLTSYEWESNLFDEMSAIESSGFSFDALLAVLTTANGNGALRTPEGRSAFGQTTRGERWTRARWEAADWNPSPHWKSFPDNPDIPHDPNADPKPTYDWLLAAARLIDLSYHLSLTESVRVSIEFDFHKEALMSAHVEHSLGEIHTGRGVGHMSGLVDIAHGANAAGRDFAPVVLRKRGGGKVTLWTPRLLRELLDGVTAQENRLENAHNELAPRIDAWRVIARDETKPLAERLKAARDAADFLENYRGHLAKAASEYDPDLLPEELDPLKEALIRRLAAAANRKRNLVLDVEDTQDAYLEAACDEQKLAVEMIAQNRQATNRRIRDAETVAKVKEIYQEGVQILRAIPTDNSPVWIGIDGERLIVGLDGFVSLPVSEPAGSRRPTVTVKVRNPLASELKHDRKVADLLGAPTVHLPPGNGVWHIVVSHADGAGVRIVTLTWGGAMPPPAGATVEVIARNACGPTRMKVSLTRPTS